MTQTMTSEIQTDVEAVELEPINYAEPDAKHVALRHVVERHVMDRHVTRHCADVHRDAEPGDVVSTENGEECSTWV